MTQSLRVAAAVAALVASSFVPEENFAATQTVALSSDPLAHLAGRWVGNAVMTTTSGPASNFKCVVTYLPRKNAPGVQQNLRCDNGADFKLHAATELEVEGSKVKGVWQDKINEIDGTVAGSVTSLNAPLRSIAACKVSCGDRPDFTCFAVGGAPVL